MNIAPAVADYAPPMILAVAQDDPRFAVDRELGLIQSSGRFR